MKKINFFFLILLLSVMSCIKSEVDSSPTIANVSLADYNALIMGKWQLTEVGTPKIAGCTDMKTHPDTDWNKTNNTESLEFKTTGEFTKVLTTDGLCKGSFKISEGYLVTKSDCNVSDIRQPINDLTANTLVIETHSFGLDVVRYKYTKL